MRRIPVTLISALSTFALLAACGDKEEAVTQDAATKSEVVADAATAAAPTGATASTPAPAAAAKPAVSKPATPAPKPVVTVLTVPAGTELALSLSTPLSTKSAKVGDAVRATVTSDVTVDSKVAIASGATVAGSVITV